MIAYVEIVQTGHGIFLKSMHYTSRVGNGMATLFLLNIMVLYEREQQLEVKCDCVNAAKA